MPRLEYLPYNVLVLSVIGCVLDFSSMPLAALLVAWPCTLLLLPLLFSLFFLLPALFPLQGIPAPSFLFGALFPQQGALLFLPSSPTIDILL